MSDNIIKNCLTDIQHLYLHVPFCRTICGYCDFCHRILRKDLAGKWLFALEKEIREKCRGPYQTIYIGGGTPSALDAEDLERLLSLLDPYREGCTEFTVEVNPESLDEEKTLIMKRHGVNRISMGVQSADDRLLKLMNRRHTFEDVREKVTLLKGEGISNISVDLMYSLPTQTMDSLKDTLEKMMTLDVPHISIYSLTVEENTAFGKKGYTPLDEDTEADMYEYIRDYLTSHGYTQYEVSNYARKGFESRHNLGYWRYDDWLGVSLGAASKCGHARYDNTKDFEKYFQGEYTEEVTELSREDEMFENVMMSFRTKEGLDLKLFEERYGIPFKEEYREAIEKQREELLFEDGRCHVKDIGILHHVLLDFLPE